MSARLRVAQLAEAGGPLDEDRALPDMSPRERERLLRPETGGGQQRDQRRLTRLAPLSERLDRHRRQRPDLRLGRPADLADEPRGVVRDPLASKARSRIDPRTVCAWKIETRPAPALSRSACQRAIASGVISISFRWPR